jgi:hypothetical protein
MLVQKRNESHVNVNNKTIHCKAYSIIFLLNNLNNALFHFSASLETSGKGNPSYVNIVIYKYCILAGHCDRD